MARLSRAVRNGTILLLGAGTLTQSRFRLTRERAGVPVLRAALEACDGAAVARLSRAVMKLCRLNIWVQA